MNVIDYYYLYFLNFTILEFSQNLQGFRPSQPISEMDISMENDKVVFRAEFNSIGEF